MAIKEIQAKLDGVLEPDLIISAPELCAAYEVDGKRPLLVLRPADAGQIGRILALGDKEGWTMIPWGGGTQMSLGNVPRAYDIAVDVSSLDQVYDYDAENLTLVAGAGCTLKTVQRLLSERRQFMPVDPPLSELASLGGLIASNAFGPSRLGYGAVRDLTLGLQVALLTGQIVSVGGKHNKNLAGYDLSKLFVGSAGTLGIITRVTCRVLPLPEYSRTVQVTFADAHDAFALAGDILDGPITPTCLDVLQGAPGAAGEPYPPISLTISFDGPEEVVEHQVLDFRAVESLGRAVSVEGLGGEAAEAATRKIRDLPATSTAPLIVRAGVPPASLAEFWARVQRAAAEAQATASILARVGLGIAYVFVQAPHNQLAKLAEANRAFAGELGGNAIVERLPADLKGGVDVWGPAREDWPLMEAIKTKFDPKRVLSPGRFVGKL